MALYGRRAEMSDAGLAFTALALAQAKPGAAEIQTLLSELRSRARTLPEGAGTRWAEPLPTTAIVLQALAQLEPANPLLPEGIRWLMGARQPAGGWRSGYYSAWALMAVTDWLKADPAAAGQATYGFSAELNGNALTATTTLLDTTWYTAPAGPVNTLSVGREAGAGTLYYSARLAVYPEIGKLPALDRGLMISREYLKPSAGCGGKGQAPCPSVSEARVGETLLVKLTLIVPSDTAYVQVEDYLPAGAEILELPDASGLVPSTLAYVPEAEAGRFRAVASADRLTLLALRLPAGVYSYTYQIAPRVAGRYAARPTLAQAAYAPEIYGRAAGSVLTVKP
jgi:uncharacterized protein YfaS (alpha-2-macroglobulin family)